MAVEFLAKLGMRPDLGIADAEIDIDMVVQNISRAAEGKTDITFTCRGLNSNQLLAKFVPVHAYEFADPNAPNFADRLIRLDDDETASRSNRLASGA